MERSEVLERKLRRAQAEIAQLERLIEDNARSLYLVQEDLRQSASFMSRVIGTMSSALFVADAGGKLVSVNPAACELLCCWEEELLGQEVHDVLGEASRSESTDEHSLVPGFENRECSLTRPDGTELPVLLSYSPLLDESGDVQSNVYFVVDISRQKELEVQLRHAQKLESVGSLAAGVAHEINTPIQFVGDSLAFLDEAVEDLGGIVEAAQRMSRAVIAGSTEEAQAAASEFQAAIEAADAEFVLEEAPEAAKRASDGVRRVATIVRAMKSFAHPGQIERAPADLNSAVETTLVVARNEYRYVAELETEFGDLPEVCCNIGDVNQVVLNLVVNAAHAIEAQASQGSTLGKISVTTGVDGEFAFIRIEDSGGGIPEDVQRRMFDPFYTTKEVGKGTGQGLSLAHNVIVVRHGGRLDYETELGVGTAFIIRLPIAGPSTGAPDPRADDGDASAGGSLHDAA